MQCNDCGKCGNLKELFFYPYIMLYGEVYKEFKGRYWFSKKFSIQCPNLVNKQNPFRSPYLFNVVFTDAIADTMEYRTLQECFDYLLNDNRLELEETLHIIKLQSKLRGV